jgi:hypothetical protein
MNLQKEEQAQKKRKKLISLFIVVVMVMSAAGFMMDYAFKEKLIYNSFKFDQTEQGFMTKLNGNKIAFNYYPTQLESINISSEAMNEMKQAKMIGVSYDPSSYFVETMAQLQYYLDTTLPNLFGIFVQKGLTNSTGYEMEELTCANATIASPMIVFLEAGANETSAFSYKNGCLTFKASTEQELVMQTERLVYGISGIMN